MVKCTTTQLLKILKIIFFECWLMFSILYIKANMVSICLAGQGLAGKGRGRARRPDIFSYVENNGFLAAIRIWEFRSPLLPPRCYCCADSWRDLSVTNFYRKKQMQKRRFLLCAWVLNRRIVAAWYVCSFENFIAVGTHHVVNLCVIWRTQLWDQIYNFSTKCLHNATQ